MPNCISKFWGIPSASLKVNHHAKRKSEKEKDRERAGETVCTIVTNKTKIFFCFLKLNNIPFPFPPPDINHWVDLFSSLAPTSPRLEFGKIRCSRWALTLHEYIHQMARCGTGSYHIQIKRHKQIKELMSLFSSYNLSLITHLFFSKKHLKNWTFIANGNMVISGAKCSALNESKQQWGFCREH